MNSWADPFCVFVIFFSSIFVNLGGEESLDLLDPWLKFNWPEADQLFQKDRNWVGGDGGYSIDLAEGRVLWLFGDSWIDTTGKGMRTGARMISNSVAIQQGYNPTRATINFFWGGDVSKPEAFFAGSKGFRYWPGHGVLLGDQLLLFLMKVHSIDGGLGFEVRGWSAVLVSNPQEDPSEWKINWLPCPQNHLSVVVGSGAVISHFDHVYAFGSKEPGPRHDIFLVRWSHDDLTRGALESIEWWCGDNIGWSAEYQGVNGAVPVMRGGQTEFTVHFDPGQQCFFQTQTEGFGKAVIVQRTAASLTGPWSTKSKVFDPPQNHFKRILIYQGKAHPHLSGASRVFTYCTNSFKFTDHNEQKWLYFPRFVRLE